MEVKPIALIHLPFSIRHLRFIPSALLHLLSSILHPRFALSIAIAITTAASAQDMIHLGAGAYVTTLPPGAKGPRPDISRAADLKGPMPTNDWWSSLAWMKFSERQYPHPLAVAAQAEGLRVFYPAKITANKDAIFGFMPEHADDLILSHSAVEKFSDAKVAGFSDWFVTAKFADGEKGMSVSYGHGSPFVYAIFDGGEARITSAKPAAVWSGSEKSAILGVTINGKSYALFGPTGSTWSGIGSQTLENHANGKTYFSLALLPDASENTLALFTRHAYAHVISTKAEPSYDAKTATLTTTFTFTTKAYEGSPKGTLFALYPHQWRNTKSPLTDVAYPSVRGLMKLGEGESFVTAMRFPGVLPALPISAGVDKAKIAALIKPEAAAPVPPVGDTYGEGKWLGKLATLIPIAEQCDDESDAGAMRDHLKARLEQWLDPKPGAKSGLFYYNKNWGTLIGYPASFGSDQELNDHHFHYGYFIKAAAEVARHDPAWAADDKWGGMIKLLIRDIASPDRTDPLFPYLRNFDPYAGHSWASGHARFGDGNNNESSSEAMNAWAGIILLGQAIGDKPLTDLGIYLYTTEMNAINEYWFDVHGDNRPESYTPSVVTMVWGGKGANGTWFSSHPPVVHGINFLPIHGGSLYLGLYPQYAEKNYQALVKENKSDHFTEWPDIIWMYRALTDPEDALRLYNAAGEKYKGEGGNTRANTLYWIESLKSLGQPDPTITADIPLYAVFKKGQEKTYTAYNPTNQPTTITFSDGFMLKARGKGFAISRNWALSENLLFLLPVLPEKAVMRVFGRRRNYYHREPSPAHSAASALPSFPAYNASMPDTLTIPPHDVIAFPALDAADLAALRPLASSCTFKDGDIVFRAGDSDLDLFVVESGSIEILNPADDNRQVVMHGPGHFAGDIDLLTRRPVIVTAIARGPTRLLRVPGQRLREILNKVPHLSEKMLIACQERRRLLSEAGVLGLKVVGPGKCRDTTMVREFLFKNFVPFTWYDSASDQGHVLMEKWGSPRKSPVIECGDGCLLINPNLRELAQSAGVWRNCPTDEIDLAIVGAGPAGMTAAVYAASEGVSTLVLDRLGPGGQAAGSSKIENFIGFPSGLSGAELAMRSVLQMLKFGAKMIAPVTVEKIEPSENPGDFHLLHLDCGTRLRARTILISAGVAWRKLEAANAERFEGAGIHYACTTVEAMLYDKQDVAVVGAGNSAGQAAMFLAECCRDRKVHLLVRKKLGPGMSDYLVGRIRSAANIIVHEGWEISAVHGERRLEQVTLRPFHIDGMGPSETIDVSAVFVFIGAEPGCSWLPQAVARDALGYILTGVDAMKSGGWPLRDREPCPLETTVPRILAAGDIRAGSTKRVGFAVGDGSLAVTCVHKLTAIRS